MSLSDQGACCPNPAHPAGDTTLPGRGGIAAVEPIPFT